MNIPGFSQSLLAVGWCVLVFIAILGWGAIALRLCGVERCVVALSTAAGLALTMIWGGILNATCRITRATSLLYIGMGLALSLMEFWCAARKRKFAVPTRPRVRFQAGLLLVAAILILLVRLLATANDTFYQKQDDWGYYLAAPEKVFDTHTFGPDPYSERREVSTLGGGLYLDNLILSELPLNRVQMTDRVLGLLFVWCLSFAFWEEFELTALQGAALTLFMVATTQIQINLTNVMLPEACFFSLVFLASTKRLDDKPNIRAALLGGTAAVISSNVRVVISTHRIPARSGADYDRSVAQGTSIGRLYSPSM